MLADTHQQDTAGLATAMTPCSVMNEDDKSFDFTAALHSYFEVLNVEQAYVNGLKGLTYLDKAVNPKKPVTKVEDREKVTFGSALVDSVYDDAPDYVELDVATGAHLSGFHALFGVSVWQYHRHCWNRERRWMRAQSTFRKFTQQSLACQDSLLGMQANNSRLVPKN